MREVSGAYEPIVAPELASLGFVQTPGGRGLVTTSPEGATVRPSMPAVNPALADRFSMKAVLSPRLEAQRVKARLFALDRADVGPEDLLLAEVVAGLVASRLDQLSLVYELQETAATAERVRLARDLHDGILQDLAGIALQLEALRPLLVATPEARGRLDALERVLETEQRDVRSVIQQLRPRSSSRHEFDLAANLEELKGTFAATWGLTLEVSGAMRDTAVPPRIRYELFRIVREAVSNAARHAGASRVRVSLAVNGSAVQVRAADDGHGFPFFGRYDLAELDKMRLGPVTLKERIAALGGSLVLDSSSMGSTLDIRLPLDQAR
jgi:signal transduction histidine kinase